MDNGGFHGSNLLAALRESDRAAIEPYLQPVTLDEGHVIYEPGDNVQHAYFPRKAALAAFLVLMEDGEAIESAMVGREGAVGGIVSNGRLPAFARCMVMHGGEFFRIPSRTLEAVKLQSPQMSHLFSRYADCLVAQIFQSAACNARHSIEQRAAKWLTAALDRTGGYEIRLTQAQLGALLGVGRSYVTRIVARIKAEGIISTRRGGIHVNDRARLDRMSCDCNRMVANHFDRVLQGVYPDPD